MDGMEGSQVHIYPLYSRIYKRSKKVFEKKKHSLSYPTALPYLITP